MYTRASLHLHLFYEHSIAPYAGLLLVVVSQFFNSIMAVTCKLLESDPLFITPIHPLQILLVRMIITYACCLLYMYIDETQDAPWGPHGLRKYLAMRGILGFFGVFGLYYSLQYFTLSDAVVMTFLIPPCAAFLAWMILGERYTVLECVCGLLSFGGVVLVARPSFLFSTPTPATLTQGGSALVGTDAHKLRPVETTDPAVRFLTTCVALLGVCGASSVVIIIRFIGKRAHPLISVSYFALLCVVISLAALIFHPSLTFAAPQTGHQWLLFALIGLSGFVMQFCLTAGIQREKAGRSSMMMYTQMVYAVFWELLIWHRMPRWLSWLGFSVIIVCAGVVMAFKVTDEDKQVIDIEMVSTCGDLDFELSDDEVRL